MAGESVDEGMGCCLRHARWLKVLCRKRNQLGQVRHWTQPTAAPFWRRRATSVGRDAWQWILPAGTWTP